MRNRFLILCVATLWGLNTSSLRAQLDATHPNSGTAPDVGIRFSPPQDVAITHANIVRDDGSVLENGTLLVKNGHIASLGHEVELPAGVQVIDCQGDYLYPAFVDPLVECESQSTYSNGEHWNPNVTPQRRMSELVQLDNDKLEALREAGICIALIAPEGGLIKGQSCVLTTSGDSVAKSMVRADGFQHMRLYPSRGSRSVYPNSPMGAMALVRQTLSDAKWYQQAVQTSRVDPTVRGPDFDAALEALAPVLDGTQPTIIDGSNELYALRADRIAREFALKLIVRGSGREYRRLDAIAGTGRTYIIPLDFPDAPELETQQQVADATLQELMDWKLAPSNAVRLEEASVPFVFTSDGLDKPSDLFDRVRQAIAAGLSEQVALQALTTRPAQLLGIDHLTGSLERGKVANILRCRGKLFDEDSELLGMWIKGEHFEFSADQANSLAGTWQLSNGLTFEAELKIEGDLDKPKGALGVAGAFSSTKVEKDSDEDSGADEVASAELKSLTISETAVSATFDAEEVFEEAQGIAFLSVTRISGDDDESLSGSIQWSDGTRSPFTGSRMASEVNDETESEEADSEEATDQVQDGDSQELIVEVNYPLGARGVSAKPAQPACVVFQNATIWTCGDAGILESADLIVRQGVIEAIGVDLDVPEDAMIVDAEGLHLSPGIIDCHSHMATDGGVNESAQAVTAEVRIGDFIDPNDITIYRQLAGGVTTSNILHGSANPIGGQNQVIKLRWGSLPEALKMSEAPAGIKFALGENVKQSNRGDEYRTRYPQTRMGVEQIMRDRFEAAKLYRQNWKRWTSNPQGLPPRKDYELEALAEILEGTRWIHCHSYRQDEILATIRVLDDYGVTIGSFQHILEGYKVAQEMAEHGAMGSSFSDWWAYKFEVYDAIPHNGALMHEAGIVVSFNSDDRELARHLNHEAAKAVKYGGVSEEEALKFVTLNPAKQLRIEEWVGSLEPGKHADLALWSRSPLSTRSACLQTWVDGRKYFDRDEDQQRQAEDEALRLKLIQEVVGSGAKSAPAKDDDPSYWWVRYDEFCHHADHDHEDEEHAGAQE